jgi:signal transduction histidine kinase
MNIYRLCFIVIAFLFQFSLSGQSLIEVSSNTNEPINLGKQVGYFEDASGALSVDEVIKQTFIPSQSLIPNFDVTTSTIWLKGTVVNNSNEELILEVENPLMDEVVFYLYHNDSLLSLESISKKDPFNKRAELNPNSRFSIKQHFGNDTLVFYISCKSLAQLIVPLNLGTYRSYNNTDHAIDFFSSMYFGIMGVMLLYNLFLFFTVRDRNYLYYSLYVITVALVQLNLKGVGFMYLWPDFPNFERYSVFIFSPLTAFASIAFIQHFINTKKFTPKLHPFYWVFVVAYSIIIVNAFVGQPQVSYNLMNVTALGLSIFMILNAAVIYKRHAYRPALFFLVAWSVFLGSIILFVLKDVGVLPYNHLTASILQIGSGLEVTLLSFALADKIKILEQEKQASQAMALSAAQQNERIIKEQNVMLEQKVMERTKALTETNNSLNQAINELKQAQSQLVESEKMASLGQLTAGIAHEINNPINFVTSNVKPLQRDINELYQLQEQTETLIKENKATVEAVNKLKENMDFDYLKTEISFLLKGINEGSTRTAEIVRGLRIFSRVDEDDIKLADINEGLESTIIIVNNQLNNRIAVEKNYAEFDYVECYPGKLNQVFLNLISNAIYAIKQKFNEEDGGKLSIATTVDGDDILISIADNGTGMAETTKQKLFEPFFTTKPVGDGTGLGLSIVYNTIKKHNGNITVQSALGEGTTFTIRIPKKQVNG